MDEDRLKRQTALRMRANEAITAALAAADSGATSLELLVADTMEAIDLVCWDAAVDPGDRLALIDEALMLIAPLKTLVESAQAREPALIAEVVRRTSSLLRRYARLIRAERAGS